MANPTPENFTAWLEDEGLTLPLGAPAPAVLLRRGGAYINAVYGPKLCGAPTGGVMQESPFPRVGAAYMGEPIPDDLFPPQVERAVYRASYLSGTMGSLIITNNPVNDRIKRQKVEGAVEREFFESGSVQIGTGGTMIIDGEIDGLMTPFLCLDDGNLPMQCFFAIGS